MDDLVDTVRPIVIVYNFVIVAIFVAQIGVSMTKLPFARLMTSFYIVDYAYVILIEGIVFITRGLFASIGAINRSFWTLLTAIPLTAMAVVYEVLMAKTYLTSKRYLGYKPHLVNLFVSNMTEYFEVEKRWECCGLVSHTDYPAPKLLTDHPSCCPKTVVCVPDNAYPVGCWPMQRYMVIALVVVICLAVADVLDIFGILLLAKDARDEDEDDED